MAKQKRANRKRSDRSARRFTSFEEVQKAYFPNYAFGGDFKIVDRAIGRGRGTGAVPEVIEEVRKALAAK